MLDRVFGPHRSVQRQACIALSALLVVLGLAIIPSMGPSRGLPVAALGVLAGAVLARMAENRVAAKASAELLDSMASDLDESSARKLAEGARASSPARLPVVGGPVGVDGETLPWTDESSSAG